MKTVILGTIGTTLLGMSSVAMSQQTAPGTPVQTTPVPPSEPSMTPATPAPTATPDAAPATPAPDAAPAPDSTAPATDTPTPGKKKKGKTPKTPSSTPQ